MIKSSIIAASWAAGVNWTIIIALIAIAIPAMVAAVQIFAPKKKISDDKLRESNYIKSIENTYLEQSREKEKKLQALSDLISQQKVEVEKLKISTENNSKSLTELKQDNRDLVQRLDYLLKQMMEYMEGN